MKPSSYIIAGPTASGKSDFAHNLARQENGVIINCDSVQVYKGIENISASPFAGLPPDTTEIDGVPYKLFSILSLDKQLSVSDYLALATQEYEKAIKAGKTPIFVGGTGYYINALINGLSDIPAVSEESRQKARTMVAEDIVKAKSLLPSEFKPTDPQRVARALEVFFETGQHITHWQKQARTGAIMPTPYRILISPDTNLLKTRIASRIPKMLSGGALQEAKNILEKGWNENRAIGAAQLCGYLRGELTYDECIENWITKTNQYAKRQRTWFRTQFSPDKVISVVPE